MLKIDHKHHQWQKDLYQRERYKKANQRTIIKDQIKKIAKRRNNSLWHIRENIENIQNSIEYLYAKISQCFNQHQLCCTSLSFL